MRFTIEQARKYAGITQVEMAKILHVNRSTYRKIEQDAGCATVRQIGIIAEHTGIAIGDIVLPFESTNVE